jgi:hypothetical protein
MLSVAERMTHLLMRSTKTTIKAMMMDANVFVSRIVNNFFGNVSRDDDKRNRWVIVLDDSARYEQSSEVINHPQVLFCNVRYTLDYRNADAMLDETTHGHGFAGPITDQWGYILGLVFSKIIDQEVEQSKHFANPRKKNPSKMKKFFFENFKFWWKQ